MAGNHKKHRLMFNTAFVSETLKGLKISPELMCEPELLCEYEVHPIQFAHNKRQLHDHAGGVFKSETRRRNITYANPIVKAYRSVQT